MEVEFSTGTQDDVIFAFDHSDPGGPETLLQDEPVGGPGNPPSGDCAASVPPTDPYHLLDDLRIVPVDASMTTYGYDEYTGQLTSITDDLGTTSFFEYDEAGRLTKTYDRERNVLAHTSYTSASITVDGRAPRNATAGTSVALSLSSLPATAALIEWEVGGAALPAVAPGSLPVQHTFSQPGTYAIEARILDDKGSGRLLGLSRQTLDVQEPADFFFSNPSAYLFCETEDGVRYYGARINSSVANPSSRSLEFRYKVAALIDVRNGYSVSSAESGWTDWAPLVGGSVLNERYRIARAMYDTSGRLPTQISYVVNLALRGNGITTDTEISGVFDTSDISEINCLL